MRKSILRDRKANRNPKALMMEALESRTLLSVVTVAPVAPVPTATARASVTEAVPLLVTCTSLVTGNFVADVRYLVPVIPLGIFLSVTTIQALTLTKPVFTLPLALVAFFSNLLNGAPLAGTELRLTVAEYIRELADPPPDPYSAVSNWINNSVKAGESVWVQPEYAAYPLMFHSPGPVYAWQLTGDPEPQFKNLPPILFGGIQPPDFIITFGPSGSAVAKELSGWKDHGVYSDYATINQYWQDSYRPELFWHKFAPVEEYNVKSDAIRVFKLETSKAGKQ